MVHASCTEIGVRSRSYRNWDEEVQASRRLPIILRRILGIALKLKSGTWPLLLLVCTDRKEFENF